MCTVKNYVESCSTDSWFDPFKHIFSSGFVFLFYMRGFSALTEFNPKDKEINQAEAELIRHWRLCEACSCSTSTLTLISSQTSRGHPWILSGAFMSSYFWVCEKAMGFIQIKLSQRATLHKRWMIPSLVLFLYWADPGCRTIEVAVKVFLYLIESYHGTSSLYDHGSDCGLLSNVSVATMLESLWLL